jgi:hypothetical protein
VKNLEIGQQRFGLGQGHAAEEGARGFASHSVAAVPLEQPFDRGGKPRA